MSEPIIPVLKPGDCLLYSMPDIVDWAIEFHTAGPVAHVEVYVGEPQQAVASRNGIGVGKYPLRVDGLAAVLRPKDPFDLTAAMAWFETVNGYGYDFAGLLSSLTPDTVTVPGHLFCSAFATLFYRAGAFDAANAECPPNKVWPVDFLKFPGFAHLLCPAGW